MGNYSTRINWEPNPNILVVQEKIDVVCDKYNMHCHHWKNNTNILAEDTVLNNNGVMLFDMGNCVKEVEEILNSHNVKYTTEDTKWWDDKI